MELSKQIRTIQNSKLSVNVLFLFQILYFYTILILYFKIFISTPKDAVTEVFLKTLGNKQLFYMEIIFIITLNNIGFE